MESSEQEIINRILKDAAEEADLIVEKSKKSAELLLENQRHDARNGAQKEANVILKRAKNEAEIIRGKTATDIRRQAGWTVLSEKNRLLQKVLDEVKDRLVNMKKTASYVPLLENLIVDAGCVLGGGTLIVLLNEKDSTLQLNFAQLTKQITARTNNKTKLTLAKEHIQSAGVMVKTVDNKIFVDNTFESIVNRREKELKTKIAKILFSSIEEQNTTVSPNKQ